MCIPETADDSKIWKKNTNKNIFVYIKTKLCLLCGGYLKSIKIIVKSLI